MRDLVLALARRRTAIALLATLAAGAAPQAIAPASAQASITLVCRLEEGYLRGRGVPIGWRYRGVESFTVDLHRRRRFGDGSCCYLDSALHRITVLPDLFIFRSRRDAREWFSINRFTGRLTGVMYPSPAGYIRGACRPAQRRF